MMPPLWMLKFGGVLLALVLAAGYGYRHGAQRVQARWDRQAQADRAAADAAREATRLRAQAAATDYEARRAAIAARATLVSPEVRNALSAPVCRPLGASAPGLRLGDVAVPAVVLDRLRSAGADDAPG